MVLRLKPVRLLTLLVLLTTFAGPLSASGPAVAFTSADGHNGAVTGGSGGPRGSRAPVLSSSTHTPTITATTPATDVRPFIRGPRIGNACGNFSLIIFCNWNMAEVSDGPPVPTTFSTDRPYQLTEIINYHYPNGPSSGSISLENTKTGWVFGPWSITASAGFNNTPYSIWTAYPNNALLPAGTYQVLDSSPANWSYDSDSGGQGFSEVVGSINSGPTAAERMGPGSPSTNYKPCQQTRYPINCTNGDFWHTFTDLSVPGRGLPLLFTRTYNALLAAQDGPLGFGWTDSYSMALTAAITGNLTVNEEAGSSVTFSPNGSGGYQAPSDVLATLVSSTDGSVYTYTRKDQDQFVFTAPTTTTTGLLLKEVDRNGYATTLSYNAGKLATVTDSAGRSLQFSYGPTGHISRISDPIGRTVVFTYDTAGNLTAAQDVGGGITRFTYDPSGTHRLFTMTDPNGGLVSNFYDSAGRVVAQTDPLSRTTTFTYTTNTDGSQTTTITDPRGIVTTELYRNNLLMTLTKGYGTPQAATWTYTYDPNTLGVASVTDTNNHTSTDTYDNRGNLLSHTDALNRTTSYQYDALNDPTAITDPLGVTTVMTYDANGNLLQVARPLTQTGQVISSTLTYDPLHPGDVIARTDPNGQTWRYGYDVYGDVITQTDPLSDVTTYAYDPIGRLVSMVSPRGNVAGANPISYTTSMTYDNFGDTTAITDPVGHATTYQYDPNRNLRVVTDRDNHATRYAYDLDNEVISVIRPDGGVFSMGYDPNGNVITRTDGLTHRTTYAYDPLNRLTSTTDPLNRTTLSGYDPAGNLLTTTTPRGYTTTYGYDEADELTNMTRPDGSVFRTGYDLDGRVISQTDALTNTTAYAYDSLNRLTAVTDPLNRLTEFGYDMAGHVISSTDPLTRTTRYAYDLADRLIAVTRPDDTVWRSGYDTDGNVISTTDALSHTTTYGYDVLDRVITQTDPLSHSTVSGYDAVGNLISVTDPLSHTTVYGYDGLNRVITATDPLSHSTLTAYDLAGNVISTTDALSHTTAYGYDAANDLTTVTLPDQNTQRTGYDADGNVITQTDALDRSTTYTYDGLDRLTSTTDPLSRTTVYTYDAVDNQTVVTDALNLPAHYSYDADHELTGLTYALTTTPDVTYTYTASGQRASMSDGTGTSTYAYDMLDRVITSTNGAGQAVGYRYDQAGNLTNIIYPDTSAITRTYDAANRLSGLTDWLGHSSAFSYDAANRLITATLPTTATTTVAYGYDAADHLTSLTDSSNGTPYWTFGYSYHASGRVSAAHDPVLGQHAYSQDTRNRLTGDQDSTSPFTNAIGWAYDPAQDLITETYTDTTQAVSDTLGYDAAGALHSLHAISGTTPTHSYVYTTTATGDRASVSDALTGGQASYGYDQADRLITLTEALTSSAPVTTATYSYDGDGLRQSKTVNGTPEAYTWDTAEGLPQLLQDGGTRYLDGPDGLPLEQVSVTGTVLYYLRDQIGSTRALLSDAGQGVATDTYSPYGSVELHTGSATTPFGFAGQYTDAETGFQYLQARYYDPATSQFLTRDPLQDVTGQPYAYVNDDPLNATDPWGLGPCNGASGQGFGWVLSGIGDLGCHVGQIKDAILNNVGSATASLGDSGTPSCDRTPDGCLDAPTPPEDQGRLALLAEQQQITDDSTRAGYANLGNVIQHMTDTFIAQPICTVGDPRASGYQRILAAVSLIPGGEEFSIGRLDVGALSEVSDATTVGLSEGRVGRFGDLDSQAVKGDDLTPHHMPQAAQRFTSRDDGAAVMMRTSQHQLTRSFGGKGLALMRREAGLPFRTVLARDLWDYRQIEPRLSRQVIPHILRYYRDNFPDLMNKN